MDLALEQAELAAARLQWGAYPGTRVQEVGRLLLLDGAGPRWLRQVRGVQSDADLEDVAAAVALVPDATVSVVDGTVDPARLAALGRVPTRLLRMAAPPRAAQPSLRVEVVGPEAAEVVEAVAREGFGFELPGWWAAPLGQPGWTQVVAFDGDRPVAVGGLHVADGTGVVSAAATVPGARGRGAQTSLLAARLHLAREQGASRVCVKVAPGSGSHRNLLRAGFVETYGLTEWAPA